MPRARRRTEKRPAGEAASAPPLSAVELAVAYVASRRRFEREVRTYLRRKRVEPAGIEEAVARLRELGLVDDGETSRAWIRDRNRFAPRGRNLLRAELKRHGVEPDVAEVALEEELPADAEHELAVAVLEKGAAKWTGVAAPVARRRMWGTLGRRGFAPDAVREAIARFAESRGLSGDETED